MENSIRAALLSTALLLSTAAHAMPIPQFFSMSGKDKDEYVAELVAGAERVLRNDGRSKDAENISQLFTKSDIGAKQCYMTFALVRVDDAKHGEQSDVADVLALSLEKNDGIKLPDSYFAMADKLKYPPQSK